MKLHLRFWMWGLLVLVSTSVYAQDPKDKKFGSRLKKLLADDTTSKKGEGLVFLPIIYYSPDTRLGLGGMGVYYFHLKTGENDSSTRLSYAKLLADYTQNRQLDIWSSWNIFLPGEKWVLKGELRYRNFPDRYYGIGNNSPTDYERYKYDYSTIKFLGLRQLRDKMFIGLDYQATGYFNITTQAAGKIESQNITGSRGGFNSGFGAVFLIDRRDNLFYSEKGMFMEVSSYFYNKAFGSHFNFENYNFAIHKYIRIHKRKKIILALQAVKTFNNGDVPFYNLATAGNDDILRGYARNRFRDQNFGGAQAEVRFKIYKRWGAVVFTGVGDVYRVPDDLHIGLSKYAVGGGLRYTIKRKENLNIRLDYGIGRGNTGFYLGIGEAF